MVKIYTFPQGSDEWFSCKLGIVSSSHFSDILAKGKGKTRRSYMLKLAAEILTGTRRITFESADMRRGTKQEPAARAEYEFFTGTTVNQVGFGISQGFGSSTDGLVGANGIIEIKSVIPEVQIETILANEMPKTHIPQVQGGMMVFDCCWCDYISYSPLMEQHIFIKRIIRDEEYIHNLKPKLREFKKELHGLIQQIRKG